MCIILSILYVDYSSIGMFCPPCRSHAEDTSSTAFSPESLVSVSLPIYINIFIFGAAVLTPLFSVVLDVWNWNSAHPIGTLDTGRLNARYDAPMRLQV